MQYASNNQVFLLLGTNLGDRFSNLLVAKNQLEITVGKISSVSGIYETAAWGKTDQPDFLNQVIGIETTHTPAVVLQEILSIEQQMGRVRDMKWGARTIDIDILFYNDVIIRDERLEIPHPALHKRRFALMPLAELIPDFKHPVLQQTIATLLENCGDELRVIRL